MIGDGEVIHVYGVWEVRVGYFHHSDGQKNARQICEGTVVVLLLLRHPFNIMSFFVRQYPTMWFSFLLLWTKTPEVSNL